MTCKKLSNRLSQKAKRDKQRLKREEDLRDMSSPMHKQRPREAHGSDASDGYDAMLPYHNTMSQQQEVRFRTITSMSICT